MNHALFASLLLLAVTSACGGDDADPHGITTCSGWTDNQGNAFTGQCEAACSSPPVSTGEQCDTVAMLGCASFTFSGVDGCCVPDTASNTIKFYECAP